MKVPGVRLQRLVEDLGTTLLEVIEADGPLDAEVTGATIFDAHDDLLISPGELLLGVGVATQADMTDLIRRLGKLHAAALLVKTPDEVSLPLREAVRAHGVPLLGLTRAASWFHVAALLRTLLAFVLTLSDPAKLAAIEARYPKRRQALLKEWRGMENIPPPP